jgi:release factor glutamine methyltransferase
MSHNIIMSDHQQKVFYSLIKRRCLREPISRILGEREFWGLSFVLSDATLDPRPDSETVVAATLAYLSIAMLDKPNILDLGTGSGCLLISLLSQLKNAVGVGVDLSSEAACMARLNSVRLGVGNRSSFAVSDWMTAVGDHAFDVVISNPPYICESELRTLEPEVRCFDPLGALDGGRKGLDAYIKILPQMRRVMRPGGLAVVEIGYNQEEAVTALFMSVGARDLKVYSDLGGNSRCISAHM